MKFANVMEIKILKGEAILLKGKNVNLILDPVFGQSYDFEISGALFSKPGNGKGEEASGGFRVLISGPGEYEVGGAQILGVSSDLKINYKIKIDGLKIAFVAGKIKDKDEEAYGDIDCLILEQSFPDLVLKLEPKIVVVYKAIEASKFLKDIGKENVIPASKVVIKKEALPQELEAVWLKI